MYKETPNKSKLHPKAAIEKQYMQMQADLMAYWSDQQDCLDPEKVENVPCSLCNSPSPPAETALFVKYHFPYLRCPTCGLVYPSPRPRIEYIEAQYLTGRFADSFYEIYLPSAEYRMTTIFRERVQEIILPRVPHGRLLDVGCSSGHFLKVAHDHGFEVHGVEPNPEMVRYATEQLALPNIKTGVLSRHDYSPNYFDAITLWDVLEHVVDPGELLRTAFYLLKPGAYVFAYTENLESFNFFVTRSDSEMFAPDVHLRHYSPETFRKEFEQQGFTVREIMTKGLDIQHIATTIEIYPGKYPIETQIVLHYADEWQKLINACGRGDNLRLFAQK